MKNILIFEEFLKIKTPEEYMAFRKNHPNVKFDIEMREHPQKVVLMYSNDENPHLHSDPKEVFIKKQALVTGAFYYIYFRGRDNEKV